MASPHNGELFTSTNRAAAKALGTSNTNEPIYVAVLKGKFVDYLMRTPQGRHLVGTEVTAVFDANSLRVTQWSLGRPDQTNTSSLGPPVSLGF